jgi:hypothetical protein
MCANPRCGLVSYDLNGIAYRQARNKIERLSRVEV